MQVGIGLAGPGLLTESLSGVRRFAWTGASDIERHLQFGDDENHLEAKVPTYTGEVQIEDGDALTDFLKYASGQTDIVELDLADLNVAQPWLWVNILDRRRSYIRHSTLVKRAMWTGLPNEFEVDDVNIMAFPFESPRCWKIRGYAIKGEEFTGDGSKTVFNLSKTAVQLSDGSYAFVVAVESNCPEGVMEEQKSGFTVSSSALTFTSAPANGKKIQIIYLYEDSCESGGS